MKDFLIEQLKRLSKEEFETFLCVDNRQLIADAVHLYTLYNAYY